jgi:hypothetical protein
MRKGIDMLTIRTWQWDEENLGELARHGVSRRTVLQIADEAPRFRRNRKNRAASHQMVGPDHGQALWVVCIVRLPTGDDVWRAITGWPARAHEVEWYRRSA